MAGSISCAVNEPGGYITSCLPAPPNVGPYDFSIFPNVAGHAHRCTAWLLCDFPGGTCGVFTSVSGTAPNRIFNIEWRAVYFADTSATANFEARLYENDPNLKFEVIIGNVQVGRRSAMSPASKATRDWVLHSGLLRC